MSNLDEIKKLEEGLIQAELGPDPKFFDTVLADQVLLDGQRLKQKVVAAHQPGGGPKFTKVEMTDVEMIDYGSAVVVTCKGYYEGPQWTGALRFMRVWAKVDGRWQIIAGTTAKA